MSTEIELLTLSTSPAPRAGWDLGPQTVVAPSPAAVGAALSVGSADAVLCLDERFPLPDAGRLERLLAGPADAWHGGLDLGTA
ncbi:MAG TPA: hypothetical protein VGM93_12460, partial [Acidimicrobiales bacterium]